MKVFFTASYWGKQKRQDVYDEIVRVLQSADGVDLISLEVSEYSDLLTDKEMGGKSNGEIHDLHQRRAIEKSQAVVIETTEGGFKIGFEVGLALLFNKPILVLSSDQKYTTSIKSDKFYSRVYKKKSDIPSIISDFLESVKNKHISVRYTGYITADQKNFLDRYSEKKNKKVAEVLRDIIQEKMDSTK